MNKRISAFLLALVVTMLLIVAFCFVQYYCIGWQKFSFKIGDAATWAPSNNKTKDFVRFKNCIFTVTTPTGSVHTKDVTVNLNAMARAYSDLAVDSTYSIKPSTSTISLVRNLNPFSFIIAGVNDSPATAQANGLLPATPTPCTADSDCPYGTVAGACGPANSAGARNCVNAPSSSNVSVTLTGEYKTLSLGL